LRIILQSVRVEARMQMDAARQLFRSLALRDDRAVGARSSTERIATILEAFLERTLSQAELSCRVGVSTAPILSAAVSCNNTGVALTSDKARSP
jgi:hypothetical protein